MLTAMRLLGSSSPSGGPYQVIKGVPEEERHGEAEPRQERERVREPRRDAQHRLRLHVVPRAGLDDDDGRDV